MSKFCAMDKVRKVIHNPIGAFIQFLGGKGTGFIPDEAYLKIVFKYRVGTRLDLENPRTFNEKIQWLKLHDRNPLYTTLVDKVKVRDFVASKIGHGYLIPLLGVWERPEDIDFPALPNQFVLKCNHNSGGLCICKDKSELDFDKVRADLRRCLKDDYYLLAREWPYKNVKRLILGERYMVEESGADIKDYKVLCFGGQPKLIELHSGRFSGRHSQDIYDTEWNLTEITQTGDGGFDVARKPVPRPDTLDEMLRLSSVLSAGLTHVRVDWYSIGGRLYFGELTLYDGSGLYRWDRPEDDLLLGSWIQLPDKTGK